MIVVSKYVFFLFNSRLLPWMWSSHFSPRQCKTAEITATDKRYVSFFFISVHVPSTMIQADKSDVLSCKLCFALVARQNDLTSFKQLNKIVLLIQQIKLEFFSC